MACRSSWRARRFNAAFGSARRWPRYFTDAPDDNNVGPSEEEFERAREVEQKKPVKAMTEGVTLLSLETEKPLLLTGWALEGALKNSKAGGKG